MAVGSKVSHCGFTRTELCILLGALTILMVTLGSSLARSREPGQRIGCVNNLRQLGTALLVYSSENDGFFPARTAATRWPGALQPFYHDLSILACPSDSARPNTFGGLKPADGAPRSYIFNGWDDYFLLTLSREQWDLFLGAGWLFGIPESAIPLPSETIAFGEKLTESGQFWMDASQGICYD